MLPLRYNLRSLLLRPTRALLTAAGIGLSVLVAVLMLALAVGLMNSIRDTGHPLNVLVTSSGAQTIEFSAVDRQVHEVLRSSPHVAEADGRALASPELFFTSLKEVTPGAPPVQALLRGVLPVALAVHDQVKVIQGRLPTAPGEVMVGPLVATQLGLPDSRLALGQTLHLEGRPWTIVGRFVAPGTAYESEIWGALDEFMVAGRREELSSLVLRARDAVAMDRLLQDLEERTDVLVVPWREMDYYAAHADSYRPVLLMVYGMAGMLALGGMFIGMNTLFAAIVSRVREVGILRTVGYRRAHIALAFMIESLLPALAGGLMASLLAISLNGLALRIPMGAFRLQMSAELVGAAMVMSLLIGLVGAAWPVWRAMRMKTVDAIRHL